MESFWLEFLNLVVILVYIIFALLIYEFNMLILCFRHGLVF